MSGATPIRLPLSQRQAEALDLLLKSWFGQGRPPEADEVAAVREVAEKLDTLRESR